MKFDVFFISSAGHIYRSVLELNDKLTKCQIDCFDMHRLPNCKTGATWHSVSVISFSFAWDKNDKLTKCLINVFGMRWMTNGFT